MKTGGRVALAVLAGALIGAGWAVQTVRSGALGDQIQNGAWQTGRDVGSKDADIRLRAIVALRGLLALPATEARYFTAGVDDEGVMLSGKCSYRVTGKALPARWWSLTLYDKAGYLIANEQNRWSIGQAGGTDNWQVVIAPKAPAGVDDAAWIPTGTDKPFELTLRTYRPKGLLASDPGKAQLPNIEKLECVA